MPHRAVAPVRVFPVLRPCLALGLALGLVLGLALALPPRPAIAQEAAATGAVAPAVTPAPRLGPGLRLLAAPGFQDARDAFAGVVPLRRDGVWGLLAADGTWAVEPAFHDIGTPGKGRLPVEKGGAWGVIDAAGHQVTPFAFQAIGQIADWTPMRWQGQWWAVGPNGQPEGQPLPFDALIGNDGTCMVGKAGGVPIAVTRGEPSAATMLQASDTMSPPSEGFVPIVQDGRAGHLDCSFGTIVGGDPEALAVRGFHQGLAARQGPQGWGFGTVFGNRVELGGTWAAAGDFAEGLAPVQDADSGLWGYVAPSGALVIPYRFVEAQGFVDGLAPARDAAGWGFIGKAGDWLVPPRFQAVKAPSQGVAAVSEGGKWGVIAVSPVRIAAQGLAAAGGPLAALAAVLGRGCPSHILPPGTAILSAPGAAALATLPPGAALGVCLGPVQSGHVQVIRQGAILGWVPQADVLPLR